jgi:ABC-type Mn2+/Zn2+ transport system ATPase subunit
MRVALACVLYRRPDLLILDEVRCDEMGCRVNGGIYRWIDVSGDSYTITIISIVCMQS